MHIMAVVCYFEEGAAPHRKLLSYPEFNSEKEASSKPCGCSVARYSKKQKVDYAANNFVEVDSIFLR